MCIRDSYEPDLYARVLKRVDGTHSIGKLGGDAFNAVLPPVFKSWRDYCLHLLYNLVGDEDRADYMETFRKYDKHILPNLESRSELDLYDSKKAQAVLVGDTYGKMLEPLAVSIGFGKGAKT